MTLAEPPAEYQADLLRLRTDFRYFASRCLFIRTKTGELLPLKLNRAQSFLHERLERQRAKGPVRAIIVKGRQLGISTYIQGRYYWRLWRTTRALKAFILTHDQDATDNLFGMAQRYHDNLPQPIRPKTKSANAKEMVFADTDCGYQVATAGSKEVGRSQTIQLLHGSEVPSWPNAESHVVSLLTTALAKTPESEGILEATAKGVGNVFHRMCMAAIRSESEYEAVFIPWFWGEDYIEPCPADHHFSDEWITYGQMHKLHWEQLYWAWKTNRELAQAKSQSPDKICPDFRQEYPATFDEAFQTSGDSFIPALSVLQAKANFRAVGADKFIGRGPLILGIDPAPYRDKLGIIDRRGIVMGQNICERWDPNPDVEYVGAKLAALFKKLQPDAVNIDTSEGFGAALYNWLSNHGWSQAVNAVNFGGGPLGIGPTGDELYANRRAEMWDLCRAWFETPGGVAMTDDEALTLDILSPQWGPGQTRRAPTNHELIMEPKDKIRERLGASPDLGDAAALTFAVSFGAAMEVNNTARPKRRVGRGGY